MSYLHALLHRIQLANFFIAWIYKFIAKLVALKDGEHRTGVTKAANIAFETIYYCFSRFL